MYRVDILCPGIQVSVGDRGVRTNLPCDFRRACLAAVPLSMGMDLSIGLLVKHLCRCGVTTGLIFGPIRGAEWEEPKCDVDAIGNLVEVGVRGPWGSPAGCTTVYGSRLCSFQNWPAYGVARTGNAKW